MTLPARARDRNPVAFSGPRRGGLLAAWAALLVAAFPAACDARREDARLAALEAGMASAQASLSALSSAAASTSAPRAPSVPPPEMPSMEDPPLPTLHAGPPGAPFFRPPPAAVGARPVAASGLLGAGPDALRRWFGEPDLRRPEGDAEIMLFLGSGCALDVVLYADAGASRRVAHAAARSDGPAAVTEADCLRGIGRAGTVGAAEAGRAAAGGRTLGR